MQCQWPVAAQLAVSDASCYIQSRGSDNDHKYNEQIEHPFTVLVTAKENQDSMSYRHAFHLREYCNARATVLSLRT